MDLTYLELEIAERVANQRYESAREDGIEDRKKGPQSTYVTDLNGMIGEIALAKYLNVYPDLAIDTGAGGVDMRYKHLTIDVKTTEYLDGHLLAPTWKQHREHADVFVLLTLDWPTEDYDEPPVAEPKGWIRAENLFHGDNIINLGNGPCFGVEQEFLRNMDGLKNQ
jgi:hypothetical protein